MLAAGAVALTATVASSCTTVDPGPNFVIPNTQFNEDYYYCHVEPVLIFGKGCGSGDPGDNGNCHFNSSAVSGMALLDHPPVDCGGGDVPVDPTQVSQGSAARADYTSVSLEMSRDYATAPIYVRPTSTQAHPRQIYDPNDQAILDVIQTWASKP